MWSWLNECPPLPPVCVGRRLGSAPNVVQTIKKLGDINILESYLNLVWSEWDGPQSGLEEMYISIQENFSGIGMWSSRGKLLQQLDVILGKLDLGLDYFQQHKPSFSEYHIWQMKGQYQELKNVLLEADREANNKLIRKPLIQAILFGLLTQMGIAYSSTFMCAIPLLFL